jgi:hypothetical protein
MGTATAMATTTEPVPALPAPPRAGRYASLSAQPS